MDGGAWWAAVHGVAKSWTRLSDFTFTFYFHELEKEMATHSSVLAWRIPGTGEPSGQLSMGSCRVRHDWNNLACTHALEKEMATHSSILPWRIPGTEEPSGLSSVGSHRVRQLSSSSSSSIIVVSYYKIMAIIPCAVGHCLFIIWRLSSLFFYFSLVWVSYLICH